MADAGLTRSGPATAAWLSVASLAISTFASVTTEFLPVGLLTNIADSLHVSEGTAGLMVTMPGLTAAITGPLLIILSGRLDRRTVLLMLSTLLVASNALAAIAPNFATMLLARVMLGVCVGGFWTFAPSATGHMVPAADQPRAMSYVLAGISVATIAGVPAGALLGNLAGWRMAFAASALVSLMVLILQLRALPRMPAEKAIRPSDLLLPLKDVGSRLVLIVALLLVSGHFVAYTFLRPALEQVFGLSPSGITALLLVFGVAGFAGTFLGGQLVGRAVLGTAIAGAGIIALALLFSAISSGGLVAGSAAVFLWGGAFGFVPVAMTTWMLKASSNAPDAGQALLVCFFQTAISLGAFVGGHVVDTFGIKSSLSLGAALTAAAALTILGARKFAKLS